MTKDVRKIFLLSLLFIGAIFNLGATHQPLPVDQAFAFSTHQSLQQNIVLKWHIKPGYYLYRDRIRVSLIKPSKQMIALVLPQGIHKKDEIFGSYQIYKKQLELILPLTIFPAGKITLQVDYQGCSEEGFCYPSESKIIGFTSPKREVVTELQVRENHQFKWSNTLSIQSLFTHLKFPLLLLTFMGFGLLLTFTPCVLPMIPIIVSMTVGRKKPITTRRAFALSLAYVLSMAMTYAIAGVLAAAAGSTLQAKLQTPWIITSFSLLFVLLAFAQFDIYELRMPNWLQERLTIINSRQKSGSYIGAAMMGCLSSLIVSPCITAPLIGALIYISQTGDRWLGGTALFALGIGMGIPLLFVGTFGNKLLPRAGVWMITIKRFFGILLLAVAIWLIDRIVSETVSQLLWAGLLFLSAIVFGIFTTDKSTISNKLHRLIAIVLLIAATWLTVDAWQQHDKQSVKNNFETVTTLSAMHKQLNRAKQQTKPVLIDFYADWCVACKLMEKHTFGDADIQNALSNFVLIRADVTKNNAKSQELLNYFHVIAPPTLIFYNTRGEEIPGSRLVGEIKATNLKKYLMKLYSSD